MARDVLLRGRGADVGVRAGPWLIRTCGAVLGLTLALLGESLGVWRLAGISTWSVQLASLAIGALLAVTAWGAMLWLLNGLGIVVLMLVSFTPLVRPLISPFVRADRTTDAPVDAVVVLSGSITDDGRITGQALDRLLTALGVAQRRTVQTVALSVVARDDEAPPITSESDQRALLALIAPHATLRVVYNVHSTRDEALAFAALGRTHGWRRVIVVTSPTHTARACAALERAGLSVECQPAESRDYSLKALDRSGNRRLVFQDVVYETVATALYRWRGWM